jgi:hypothetical protein
VLGVSDWCCPQAASVATASRQRAESLAFI